MLSPRTAVLMADRHASAWPPRRIGAAVVAGIVFVVAVGVPTGVVPSPVYTRMTPVLWWNYPVWAVSAVLGGLVVATYIRRPGDRSVRSGAGAASGGGLLAAFAVGCPVCNKLVIAVLGVSGAMTIWAPIQPTLGVMSILGLAWVLRRRVRNEYACSVEGSPRSSARANRKPTGAAGQAPPVGDDAGVGAADWLQPNIPRTAGQQQQPTG